MGKSEVILKSLNEDIEKLRNFFKEGYNQAGSYDENKLKNIIIGLQNEVDKKDKRIEFLELSEVGIGKEIQELKRKNENLTQEISRQKKDLEYHISLISKKNEEIERLKRDNRKRISYDTGLIRENDLASLFPEFGGELQKLKSELVSR
jgi:hypothetical protein